MKSSCKNLDVFDFKEEDESAELDSVKLVSKFQNPRSIDKYNFLENFEQKTTFQSTEMSNLPCADVDAMDNDHNCHNAFSYLPLGMEDPTSKQMCGLDGVLPFNSTSHGQHPQFLPDAHLEPRASSSGEASPGDGQLNALQESLSSDESGDVIPDADENISEDSPPSSNIRGEDGPLGGRGPLSDHCFGSWEMGDLNAAVVYPDYIIYRGTYCTKSVLIFSSTCIEMKASTACGNQETLSYQWEIDNIVAIESEWSDKLRIAIVKLRLISKDAIQAEDVQGTSGIEVLQFAVVDLNWCKQQERIISLDVRYKALCNVVFDTCIGGDREAFPRQNDICMTKERYFPNFDEPFEEVVYPKGDYDAVSISKRDVDLLQPDTFVNDTIIDFYIKYLKNEMQPEERHRFHFFNSFFFRKLIDLDKDPASSFEGRAAFQRVRKWTRKVNLFEKDYVFIPVNFNYHWSLIVICHPGEVVNFQDEDVEKSPKVPCILHMDSIKGNHTGLKDFVQSYLWEEWKERQKEASEDISSKFLNLRFVPLELPQQQNSFDCGLFLLHYVERFLEEAPLNFSPFKITKFSKFLNMEWFPAAEPSLKRVHIQKLICKMLERENSPDAFSGKPCASNYPTSNDEITTGVELISERCSTLKSCHGNLYSSRVDQGIEITLLPTSSQCTGDSSLVLREFLEAGATAGSFLDGQYQTFDRSTSFNEFKVAMSSMEEDDVAGQFVYSPSNRTGFQQLAGINPGSCVFPYSSRDFGVGTSWNPGIHQAVHEDIDASLETSICASDDSLEVEVKENTTVGEDFCIEEKIDQSVSPSPEKCLTETLVSAPSEMVDVAYSHSSDHLLDSNGNADPFNSCPKSLLGLSHQDCDVQENGDTTCADTCLIGDSLVSESDGPVVLERIGDDSTLESNGQQQVIEQIGDDSVSESNVQQQVIEQIGDDSVLESNGQQQVIGQISDDSVSESNVQQQVIEQIGNDSVSESNVQQQVIRQIGDDSVSESNGQQQVIEQIGNDSVSESNVQQQVIGQIGDDSVLESNGQQQVIEQIGDDSVLESNGQQQVIERIGDDSLSGSNGQQGAKRTGDDSVPELDELQPTKRLRITPTCEGEIILARSVSEDLQL